MVVAAAPRSMTQVAAVLAFVISHTTFLAAQDDETGRCPKVGEERSSCIASLPHAGRAIWWRLCRNNRKAIPKGRRIAGFPLWGSKHRPLDCE